MTVVTRPEAAATEASNPYGHIDPGTLEFVITRPDTPTPWINYLGSGEFGGFVSNTGGGFAFDRDPRNRRVTRYRYNAIPADQPGRYVYIRDQETGESWSPTWQPVRRQLDAYECRHGPGYTKIAASLNGVDTSMLYFVPPRSPGDPCPFELWVLHVTNRSDRRRHLRTFSYAEFSFTDAAADQQNLDWAQHILSSRRSGNAILASTRFSPTTLFFASPAEPVGFTSDREAFVGPYRDLADPIVVERGEPTNEGSPRGNSIGSLAHDLVLAPGEKQTLVYLLGVTDTPEMIPGVVREFAAASAVDAAFAALRRDWNAHLARFSVETPDEDTNAMLNVWNQVQCASAFHWSRFVSGYETGLGRGMGTRDGSQDILGIVHALPAEARRRLVDVWSLQFDDGHAWHQFYPLTGEGAAGLAAERPEFPQWFSDDHLWLVISTCAYLRETGDIGFLDERVGYADGGDGTVWEHVLRAVAFTLEHRGPHGLPRAGYGDWDDTLNVDHGSGLAESVWTAMQFCRAMQDLEDVSRHVGDDVATRRFRGLREEMAAAVNASAWDGQWFLRAFDDDGRAIGASSEPHHAINLNPQTWSVIGGVASREQAERSMRSALAQLETPFGVALLRPPYDGRDERVLGTATYPPGAKENGGIFCHAHAWAVVAAAQLGWAEDAWRMYREIMPLGRSDADRYLAEPYVYAQNICGPTHPAFGMARNSWLTGTAAWTFVAATQWILGIRPELDGLRVHPIIPASWPGFRAHRVFRDAVHEIEVRRGGEPGEVRLCVNGRQIEGDVLPLPSSPGGVVRVEVVVGPAQG